MIIDEIREELFRLCDTEYRDFQVRLIPTVAPELVIGVRTPVLRKYAGQLFLGYINIRLNLRNLIFHCLEYILAA